MPRPLASLAAIACLVLLAAAPARAQALANAATALSASLPSLYADWLSGWNRRTSNSGDALRIGRDPETGTWGAAPVDEGLRASGITPPALVIRHPNGTIETILDPSVMDWLVVRLGAAGRPTFDCVSGASRDPILEAPAAAGPPDR